MRKLAWLIGMAALGFGSGFGCASSAPAGPKNQGDAAANVPPAPAVDQSRCDPKGKRVQTLDTNGDGKADLWKLYVAVMQGGQAI